MDEPGQRPTREAGARVGAYRILGLLGEGGMGRVYLAEHVHLGLRVALKMLRSDHAGQDEIVRRFFAEARAVAAIAHEHVVEITDFIEDPGGDNAYVMELLEGRTLRELLDGGEPLPLHRSLSIGVQVAEALAAVHAAGVVHRDLKPDNIFLIERRGERDFVKVLDFGVAKLLDVDERTIVSMGRTAHGAILGTPEYMSPEQASGRRVDYRSDVYSLGIVLYELVAGTRPFAADSFGELIVERLTAEPAPPSSLRNPPAPLPAGLDELILRCLATDPRRRVQTMAEVERRLRRMMIEDAGEGSMLGRRRRRGLVSGAAAAATALAASVALATLSGGDGAPAPERERQIEAPSAAAPEPAATEMLALELSALPQAADEGERAPGDGAEAEASGVEGAETDAESPGADRAPPAKDSAGKAEKAPGSGRARSAKPTPDGTTRGARLDRDAVIDPFADTW